MTAPKLTKDQISELKQMIADGLPRTEIAEAFGVGVGTVAYHAIRAGYATRGDAEVPDTVVEDQLQVSIFTRSRHWIADAECAQVDPEIFFPEKGGSSRQAKEVCARCLVQAECLDDALEHNERFGIWGGQSERNRRKLQTQLEPGAHPADTGVCGTYPRGYQRHAKNGDDPCEDCRSASVIYAQNRRTYGSSRPVDINDLDGPGSGIPATQPIAQESA
jgi:WhiB family redox-sensing transcriptional regulator